MTPVESGPVGFRQTYGVEPSHCVRVPGRAVLIGDHIDYAELSVLPMAIDRRITLWLRPRHDGRIRIASADAAYAPREFEAMRDAEPFPPGDWGNYAVAAVREFAGGTARPIGLDAVVDSTVPPAAGLSSSSALVVAFALAFLKANGLNVPRMELAARLARAERFTGPTGGGMDQAICINARAGHAARIDFAPLRITHIPVPTDWRFIIASSLDPAPKGGAVREAYNDRVRQCREAFARLSEGESKDPPSIRDLIESESSSALIERASRLPDRLLRRLRHVVSESARVHAGEAAMRDGDAAAFGALMSRSHASLRDDYEVSTPGLDRLVDLACEAGAAGARLSGAGFGGCAVALVRSAACDVVVDALADEFYRPRGVAADATRVFIASPTAGAAISRLGE